MVFCCFAANAQVIQFSETAAEGSLDGKSFTSSGLVLTVTDTKKKVTVDANNCYFGTTETYTKYSFRLSPAGDSRVPGQTVLSRRPAWTEEKKISTRS